MKKINRHTMYRYIFISIAFLIIFIKIIPLVYDANLDSNALKKYLSIKANYVNFGELKNQIKTCQGSSFDFSNFKGEFTLMEFTSTKGTKIKITDESNISKGKLYIIVLDSNYKNITIHDSGKKSSFDIIIPNDGKYLIRLNGKNASGNLNLKLTSDTNLNLIHKDIFS